MDEGLPVAYGVLEKGVAVVSRDGVEVGTVEHVVSAPSLDIFHGLVIGTHDGRRFVPADQIASLHERGVDLQIDAAAVAALPEPHGGAPVWRDEEPGVKPSRWTHFVDILAGKDPRSENWDEEDT